MAEIGKLGNQIPPGSAAARGAGQTPATGNNDAPIGQPGALGQPTGQPVTTMPPGTQVLPDVLAGRDPSQMQAAERMRSSGGASAIEQQLGLNLQPSVMGALAAPPGNLEALRHMTPTMRRTVMRGLLEKQRARLRGLARLVRHERDDASEDEPEDERQSFADELFHAAEAVTEKQVVRARDELGRTARMLDLLDELLVMQDYTLSQMGTFSQG